MVEIVFSLQLDFANIANYRELTGRRGGSSVLSLWLLEDKQHLGGEDCNIKKIACSKLEY